MIRLALAAILTLALTACAWLRTDDQASVSVETGQATSDITPPPSEVSTTAIRYDRRPLPQNLWCG